METINTSLSAQEEEIIAKILNGEQALFEVLIRRTNSALYRMARCYGFNHQDAEDLMQDTHITAYLHLKEFQGRSSYKTWISKIMLHKCLYKLKYGYYKKEVSGYPLTEENSITMPVAQPQISTEKTVANRELAQVLENSLMHIPDHYRVVFILREIEGLPVAETAEVLGITPVNVKVKLNRAKAMLQKELEKRYTRTELFDFHLVYCDKIVSKVMQAIKNLESASPSDVNL